MPHRRFRGGCEGFALAATAHAVALCVTGCMETPASSPDPARAAPAHDALLVEPLDMDAIAVQVAAHRGVALTRAIHFARWDEGAMFRGVGVAGDPANPFFHDFGLAQVDESVTGRLPALLLKGLSGLYDDRTKVVWVHGRDDKKAQTRAWTLAHEIEHALQGQSSKLTRHPQTDDEALALRALIEGDAEITTAAFIASRRLSSDHWLAELLSRRRDAVATAAGFGDVPDFVRRQWIFPYVDGTLLVGSIYRAGGYALVDRMFEHPPITTAQVLHPEKYLAGEMPVSVSVPAAPEGYSVVASGTMGELRTRALVAPCGGSPVDEAFPAWAGDAYTVVAGDGPDRAILWSTAWDDEAAARRFAEIVRAGDACIGGRLGKGVAETATVAGDRARVAYVRGLPADVGAAMARALLSAPADRPVASPPLGDVRLRPVADPQAFMGKGSLRAGRYVSEPLGLSLSVQGFDVLATTLYDEVTLEEYFGLSVVRLTVDALLTSWTPELEARIAWDVMGAEEDAGVPIIYLGETGVATGVGPGRALRWSRGQGTNAVLLRVPVCGGKITLVIRAAGGGPGMWDDVQRVARRLRFDGASPACKFVTDDLPPPSHT
jgi:hypothetical protein